MIFRIPATIFLCGFVLAGAFGSSIARADSTSSASSPSSPAASSPESSKNEAAISIKGSDTMVILGQRWAEGYMKRHPEIKVQVSGGGSGTGIAALINGTTDIAQASRPMEGREKIQYVRAFKRKPIEIPVALDGIVVVIHKDNPVTSLTLEQLRGIYRGEIHNWKEVGGKPGPIVAYGRENSSGTYGFFKEHVLKNMDFSAQTQTLAGTAAIINAVSKDAQGIGYSGHGYSAGVKLLPLAKDAASPAIEATEQNVADGSYPLSRNLFFYLDKERYAGSVKDYVEFCLGADGQGIVMESGYFPLKRPSSAPKEGSSIEKSGAKERSH